MHGLQNLWMPICWKTLVKNHDILLTVEEGSIGGFSSQIHQALIARNLAEKIIYRPLYFPDKFIDHASQSEQYQQAGLDREAIASDSAGFMPHKITSKRKFC